MSDHAALVRAIGDIFERKLHLTVPSPSADLFESGGLDSLSLVELLLQLELEYGLRIQLQELELANFRSIESIAAFVRQRLEGGQAPARRYGFAAPPQPGSAAASIFDETIAPSETVIESIFDEGQGAQPDSTQQYIYMDEKCPA